MLEPITGALKAARRAMGLSQAQLGQRLRFSQSRVSKIERGAVDLRASTLITIARALDLEVVLVPHRLVPLINRLQEENSTQGQRPRYELDDDDE